MVLKKMMLSIAILCVVALVCYLTSSSLDRVFENKGKREELRNKLVGTWMITPDGVETLIKLDYEVYTNQSDHILLLNPDGTCVFKSFCEYKSRYHRHDPSDEHLLYEGFYGEGSHMWPKGVANARSWYVSDFEKETIRGPYDTTNIVMGTSEQLHKNRNIHWEIVPRWAFREWMINEDFHLGIRCKWHLWLTHPNFSGRTFFHIVESDSEIALWRSSTRTNWYGDRIYFRKIKL